MNHKPYSTSTLVGLLLATLASPGCGNFSNDDLVFLAAIPRRDEVSIDVDQSQTQATANLIQRSALSVGEPSNFYSDARGAAANINGAVGELLGFVDTLGRGYPATHKTEDSRIWGPVKNVDNTGRTLRLEIRRDRATQDPETGAPTYTFCLQLALDADYTGGKGSCDPSDAAGLKNLLWGSYNPAASSAETRSGAGELFLDFDAAQSVGSAEEDEKGFLSIDYQFSQGGIAKSIGVDWSYVDGLGASPEHFEYAYSRDATGTVDFYFEFLGDLVGGGFMNPFSLEHETVIIDARWTDNGPGVAEAQVIGGDVPAGSPVSAKECWSAAQNRTFYRLTVGYDSSQDQLQGDESSCPTL